MLCLYFKHAHPEIFVNTTILIISCIILAIFILKNIFKVEISTSNYIWTTVVVAVIGGVISLISERPYILYVAVTAFVANWAYTYWFFKTPTFTYLRSQIDGHAYDCNQLNSHIAELRLTYSNISSFNYGSSLLADNSLNPRRNRYWQNQINNGRTHNCSASVLKNAHDQPLKYLCKYFDIPVTEDSLTYIESVLNNFSAAEQGRSLLINERARLFKALKEEVPFWIWFVNKSKLFYKLGYDPVVLDYPYFPTFTFQHISPGGTIERAVPITLNLPNLDALVSYLGSQVAYRQSIAGQRALMTTHLRELIKQRDNFTCRSCRLSTGDEPNLLLEIDHIIPVSKGGLTEESNLQTLCWRCNRSKGARIL